MTPPSKRRYITTSCTILVEDKEKIEMLGVSYGALIRLGLEYFEHKDDIHKRMTENEEKIAKFAEKLAAANRHIWEMEARMPKIAVGVVPK